MNISLLVKFWSKNSLKKFCFALNCHINCFVLEFGILIKIINLIEHKSEEENRDNVGGKE